MSAENNIFLVGMPGAGKTTIARLLAKRLKRGFVDTDQEIERRTGVKVPVVFDIEGEAGFRERESSILAELVGQSGRVIATGGGIVLRPENRTRMSASGVVIYLHANPQLLFERTRHDHNRPLLRVADPLNTLETLYAARDPLYREAADIIVSSQGGSVGHMIRQIEAELARCVA